MSKNVAIALLFFLIIANQTVAQWLPIFENTKSRIADVVITPQNRFILTHLDDDLTRQPTYFKFSDDAGQTWQSTNAGISLPQYTGLGLLGQKGTNLFSCTGTDIWKSNDNGNTWTPKPLVYANYYLINNFVADDKRAIFTNNNYESFLIISKDGGEKWDTVSVSRSVPSAYISGIYLRSDTVFLSTQYHIYRGVEANNKWTWTDILLNRASYADNFSSIAAPDSKTIVVTARSNNGLFISHNGGDSWESPVIYDGEGKKESSFEDIYIFGNYWVLSSAASRGKIFVSIDQGKTWKDFTGGLPRPINTYLTSSGIDINKVLIDKGIMYVLLNNSIWKRPLSELVANYLETPTFLKASTERRNTHDVSWKDNSFDETGFIVERAESNTTSFKEIARLPKDSTRFTDLDLPGRITYYYRLKAFNNATSSRYSEILKIERPPNACKVVKAQTYFDGFHVIKFITEKTGFALTQLENIPLLIRTDDGGVSWRDVELNLGEFSELQVFSFLDNKIGFIDNLSVSPFESPHKLMTLDGGNTWRRASPQNKLRQKNYNSLRQSVPLNNFFIDDSLGCRGSLFGGVTKTTNGGKTWNSVFVDSPSSNIVKGFFMGDRTGFAIEFYGNILRTTDLGDNWAVLNTPVVLKSIIDMYSPDKKTIYFVGNQDSENGPGVILKTSDNGKNFEVFNINLAHKAAVHSISFVGTVAWITTNKGELYKSEDNYKTWQLLSANPKIDRSTISFKNKWGLVGTQAYEYEPNGSIISSRLMAYMTYDGGHTWQDIKLPSNGYNVYGSKVKIFDDNKAVVLTEDVVYKTTNRGKTWSTIPLPFGSPSRSGYITEYTFTSENVWYIAHRYETDDYYLYKTTDGGITWKKIPQVENPVSTLYFFDETLGFVKGSGSHLYRTDNGGDSWTILDDQFPVYYFPQSIRFATKKIGFMSGRNNALESNMFRTENGGITWQELNLSQEIIKLAGIWQVYFLNDQIGFARAGFYEQNKAIVTTDAGKTWTVSTPEEFLSKYSSLVNFDDFYEENLSGSLANVLYHYELKKASVAHEPNGDIQACQQSTGILYEVDDNNAYSYQWKLSGGGTLSTNRHQARVKWNSIGTFKLSVKTINDCGESNWIDTDITSGAPVNKPTLLAGDTAPCPKTTTTYRLNSTPNYNYEWFYPKNINAKPNKNELSVSWGEESKNYFIKAVAKDAYCPSDTLSIDIKMKTFPATPTISSFDGVSLMSSSTNNNQWRFNAQNITGAIEQKYIPNQGSGAYSVKVSTECGEAVSESFLITITSLNTLKNDTEIIAYPNPAQKEITIQSAVFPLQSITIYDMRGTIIERIEGKKRGECSIEVSNLTRGVYLLSINTTNGIVYKKMIIE